MNFSRLLQGVETRTAAKDVMLGLPRVPTCCLSLLRLLVHTGTRAIAPTQGDQRTELICIVQQTVRVTAQVTLHHITSYHTHHHTASYIKSHHITRTVIIHQCAALFDSPLIFQCIVYLDLIQVGSIALLWFKAYCD